MRSARLQTAQGQKPFPHTLTLNMTASSSDHQTPLTNPLHQHDGPLDSESHAEHMVAINTDTQDLPSCAQDRVAIYTFQELRKKNTS